MCVCCFCMWSVRLKAAVSPISTRRVYTGCGGPCSAQGRSPHATKHATARLAPSWPSNRSVMNQECSVFGFPWLLWWTSLEIEYFCLHPEQTMHSQSVDLGCTCVISQTEAATLCSYSCHSAPLYCYLHIAINYHNIQMSIMRGHIR